jgi:GNAT superfamily N-acetyltransferase
VHAWTVELGGPVAWLEEFYVVRERREVAIGSELLQRAIEVARQRDCLAIDLEVDARHGQAPNLYQRAEFRPLARTHWTFPLTSLGDAVTALV